MLGLACTLAIVTGSCIDQSWPVAPRQEPPVPAVDLGASDGCARFQVRFDAGGQPLIETLYGTSHCPAGEIKLLSDTVGSFNPATGALRVPIVMENVGTVALIPRVKLRFNADSVVRYDSAGNVLGGTSDIVGYLPDSASANGRIAYWWYDQVLAPSGQPQVLLPGARTQPRWMELRGTTWAYRIRMKFLASGVQQRGVPMVAPDTIPGWLYADSNVVRSSPRLAGRFLRNVVAVLFTPNATQAQGQAVGDSLRGTVVGGMRFSATEGFYLFLITGDALGNAVLDEVSKVKGMPGVLLASTERLNLAPQYLRPVDSTTAAGWSVFPASSRGAALNPAHLPLSFDRESLCCPRGCVSRGAARTREDPQTPSRTLG